ncbi:hypothetical protein QFZ35_000809 [Arthrobacter ulcerisalmonis]|nr:hypothetical protein [Arthrobacter ulcerisalmonis]
MIELAGLIAAAVLLVTLVTLEVRRVGTVSGPGMGQPADPALQRRARSTRVVVGVMWVLFVTLLFPRVLGLLT